MTARPRVPSTISAVIARIAAAIQTVEFVTVYQWIGPSPKNGSMMNWSIGWIDRPLS